MVPSSTATRLQIVGLPFGLCSTLVQIHILPALFVPGPEPPATTESFLLPASRHCSALQKEGLRAWDGSQQEFIDARPFFAFGTADTVGITVLNGFVGHNGGHDCRLHCGFRGRHKPNQSIYYAAALRPNNYTVHPHNQAGSAGSHSIHSKSAHVDGVAH